MFDRHNRIFVFSLEPESLPTLWQNMLTNVAVARSFHIRNMRIGALSSCATFDKLYCLRRDAYSTSNGVAKVDAGTPGNGSVYALEHLSVWVCKRCHSKKSCYDWHWFVQIVDKIWEEPLIGSLLTVRSRLKLKLSPNACLLLTFWRFASVGFSCMRECRLEISLCAVTLIGTCGKFYFFKKSRRQLDLVN